MLGTREVSPAAALSRAEQVAHRQCHEPRKSCTPTLGLPRMRTTPPPYADPRERHVRVVPAYDVWMKRCARWMHDHERAVGAFAVVAATVALVFGSMSDPRGGGPTTT